MIVNSTSPLTATQLRSDAPYDMQCSAGENNISVLYQNLLHVNMPLLCRKIHIFSGLDD